MSSIAVWTFLSECITEVGGHVPARVLLQQIIQQYGVVCSGCVTIKSQGYSACMLTRFGHVVVVVVVVVVYDSV
jgi:hypothetical protein